LAAFDIAVRFATESGAAGHRSCGCAGALLPAFLWGLIVKHVVILAALGLTACALPGASGTGSLLGGMHPTQEFCASRQMTLDPATKQCVTPSQQAATQSPPTTGSVTPSPASGSATGSSPQSGQQQPAQQQPAQQQPAQRQAAQQQAAQTQSSSPAAAPAVSIQPAPFTPPATPAASPPQERARSASAMPVEADAVIYPELRQDAELMYELAHYVRASGYRCDSISALQRLSYAQGFKLVCNHFNYKYVIEQKDGRSTVAVE
jgi:hypothetical protein